MLKKKIKLESFLRLAFLSGLFLCGIYLIPHNWCAREAGAIFRNNGGKQERMAKYAEKMLSGDMDRGNFKTGSDLFNGEWLFGTYMMSGMGFGQMAVLKPDKADEYLRQMEEWYGRLNRGFAPVLEEWKKRAETLGRRVRLTDAAGTVEGVAVDLDKDGGLLVRQDSGVIVKKMAGDVVHCR